MQVTETLTDGLKREFQVTVPAADLEARVAGRLSELKDRVQLRGFRPGKVPVTHLRKVYGRSVMAETVEAIIREMNAKIVEDRGLKLAMEPKVTIPNQETEVERVLGGQTDLAYTLSLEVLPKIELGDFQTIKLDRFIAEVTDAEVAEALDKIAEQNKPYAAKGEGAKAEKGDRVVIDFAGKIDGTPFEGGTGGDVGVNIGSGTFIPGFEDQLTGIAAGEQRTVTVTFPSPYQNEALAGKNAEFEVTAKSIEAPAPVAVDDAFAVSLGLESLDKLQTMIKERIAREHAGMSRQKLKRQLLDQLDQMHKFAPPPTLVEDEFNNVWTAIESDLKQQNRTFADEGTTEEKAREEYRVIAERRVRLGLVLADIGEKNNIKVSEEELSRAIVERARQIPGREQEVWDYYRKNPQAVASVRAPIFEEKVVDFLVELAKVTDKPVTREELYKDDDEDKAAA
ncbi:MAG: trigger factor [Alphaproteobacteria bacterium]|jgi:trigger factor|nr:trigger factor [Alphaproteobacteria bacterium]